ncbi:hypothetical protein MASR2M48_14520 [Spirochaetota bacterium]
MANRLFVFGDEAFGRGDRKKRGKLKTIISSNDMRITYKMKDNYYAKLSSLYLLHKRGLGGTS